jgi:hypothetical protein
MKATAKDASRILLATDEDREGESISWHILQLLNPKKSVEVQRIVFHEITPEAIKQALAEPRSVDEALVRAQETRRILDRLYGYTLSPLLWKKVAPGLSAGRVQSVAVRLVVEREREIEQFEAEEYWSLEAELSQLTYRGQEKRPFFLENAGQFSVGAAGEVDLFFTRRIGIGPQGQVVPIIGGGRLSGKINDTNIGMLNMTTRGIDAENIDGNNFSVARVNHQIGQRSSIGGIFVNRQNTSLNSDFNRTFAVDGKYGIGKKATISGYAARTNTPGETRDENAFKVLGTYEWNGLRSTLGYSQLGEGFNPEAGFLFRSAYRKPEASVFKQVRMNGRWGFLEFRPHATYRSFWNFSGFQETSYLHVDNHWVWVSGLEIHTGVNFTTEGVVTPFTISKKKDVQVPAGTYNHREAQLVLITNPSKPFYANVRSILGGSFGGDRYLHSGTVGMRVGKKFNSEFTLQMNDVRLPDGNFVQEILAARVAYSFKPRINLQSFVQYNSEQDLWSFNIRFNILEQANTGLFLVYNDVYTLGEVRNRSFTIKYTHVFDLLKK